MFFPWQASVSTFFCADCSQNNQTGGDCGNQTEYICKSVSVPATCYATGVKDAINCTIKEGTFAAVSPGYEEPLCLFAVNATDMNGSSCYNAALCRNNRQLCSLFDVCYVSSLNKSDCISLQGNGTWPLWVSESDKTSADSDNLLIQLKYLYRGNGFCLFGVKDMSVSSGGMQVGYFERRDCSSIPGSSFLPARTFVSAKWFDRISCQRGVCSGAVRILN